LAIDGICNKDNIEFYKTVVSNSISQNANLSVVKGKTSIFKLNGNIDNNVFVVWDNIGISFQLNLKTPYINCWSSNIEEYDGINLRIYNPDYDIEKDNAVRNIFVCFKKNDAGEIISDVSFNQKDPTQKGTMVAPNVEASLNRTHDYYQITITVPWSLQNIDPATTNYLGLDCTVHLTGTNEKNVLLFWTTTEEPYYNPAKFGRLSLTKPQ
jgi:hypothetical protein